MLLLLLRAPLAPSQRLLLPLLVAVARARNARGMATQQPPPLPPKPANLSSSIPMETDDDDNDERKDDTTSAAAAAAAALAQKPTTAAPPSEQQQPAWWDGRSFWDPGSARGLTCGLRNVGNSCYMNSTLQALGHTSPLAALFVWGWPVAIHPGSRVEFSPRDEKRFRFTEKFVEALAVMWMGKCRDFAPIELTRSVIDTVPEFRAYGQQDAHEAICYMLNNLHEECMSPVPTDMHPAAFIVQRLEREREALERRAREARAERTKDASVTAKRDEPFLQATKPYQKSVVSDNFYSLVSQTVTCTSCGQKSLSLDEALFLQLALPTRVQLREVNRALGRANSEDDAAAAPAAAAAPSSTSSASQMDPNNGNDSPGGNGNGSATANGGAGGGGIFSSWFSSLPRMPSLPSVFSPPPALTLEECLRFHFGATEKIEYQCMCCDGKRDATLRLELEHAPEILCVQLKRFNKRGGWGLGSAKMSTLVRFPLTGLDVSDYLSSRASSAPPTSSSSSSSSPSSSSAPVAANGSSVYDLFAVVRHQGGIGSGHYTSVCLNRRDNQWYEFDDELVSRVPPETLQTSDAYLLLYSRRASSTAVSRKDAVRKALASAAANTNATATKPPVRYVAKSWVLRFDTTSDPGPVDNSTFACAHGGVAWPAWPDVNERVLAVPVAAYDELVRTFGVSSASPAPVTHLEPCEPCRLEFLKIEAKRKSEFEIWSRLFREDQAANQANPATCKYYALSVAWFAGWKSFVHNDVGPYGRGSFLGAPVPGVLDNSKLLEDDGSGTGRKRVKRGLRPQIDFHFIGPTLWAQLVAWYGGGPAVASPVGVVKNPDALEVEVGAELGGGGAQKDPPAPSNQRRL